MSRIVSHRWARWFGFPFAVVLIAIAMTASLARHGDPMIRAVFGLSPAPLGFALLLSLIYRLINATGWGMVLRALGEPVSVVPAARVWLASEACRWLPGSLWSFGSRAVLASRRGISGHVVAASLALELAVTAMAWCFVAALGWGSLKLPASWASHNPLTVGFVVLVVSVATAGSWIVASRSSMVRNRLAVLSNRFGELRTISINFPGLFLSFLFFIAMGIFNGATLLLIVRAFPGGSTCPVMAVISANAVSWLVGFFAIIAPGGLIVREACLASLLVPWMTPGRAIAVALAWRLIQIVAEILCFAVVAVAGLPTSMKVESDPMPKDCPANRAANVDNLSTSALASQAW